AAAGADAMTIVAEITLAVILFTDASAVNLLRARADAASETRVLLIGFPLLVVAGAAAGSLLLPQLGWAGAPTDAALGAAVVGNRAVPERIRRILNVESGFNDGLAAPLVAFFIAVVAAQEVSGSRAIPAALGDIAVGVAVGAAVGVIGAAALLFGRHHWLSSSLSEDVGVLSLAVLSFVAAHAGAGNGVQAALRGGVGVARGRLREGLVVSETVAVVLSLLLWTVFGALMAAPMLTGAFQWRPLLYALISLVVLRAAAVTLSFIGSGAHLRTRLFIGWFGPRGLASAVFAIEAVLVLQHLAPEVSSTLLTTTTWTILLSVILHGSSARPLAARYAHWCTGLTGRAFERRAGGERIAHRRHSLGGPGAGLPSHGSTDPGG
ncbi:MAG TPA: cation:proton antiporter, partial [Miltoncostaeaceae bacterium]|nr:cation:proton antiporter [Miltoncostaeaceae bacterium]